MRISLAAASLLLVLTGCNSEKPTINTAQSLVMESSVLSAGIITDAPVISGQQGQQRASAVLYNQQEKPVQVNYRFYWYDDTGLEILPFEQARTVVVPAHAKVEIASQIGNLSASNTRLYLYL